MDLTDIFVINSLLKEFNFDFKKSLGQNFLTDGTVCPFMAQNCADNTTGVIEIGPGFGVLTKELCKIAKKVVTVELDKTVLPVLNKTLAEFDNLKIINADILKTDIKKIIRDEFSNCEKIAVCANLPYYITSPIITSLLSQNLPIENITVMVQKEAAIRLCSPVGSRDAGAVTAFVEYFAESEILRDVNKSCFVPSPKVNSAVIKLTLRKAPKVNVSDEKGFFTFVKAAFAQRRKTLANSVNSTLKIPKEDIFKALVSLNLNENVRAEKLDLSTLASLYENLKIYIK